MPTLTETQQLLWRLITAPEGVAAALDVNAEADSGLRRALTQTVRSTGGLDAAARLDVYANMYFFRILDVLKEDYPGVLAAVGDVAFHNLITDYLLSYPSAHFSLRYVGRHLAVFVAAHPLRDRFPFVSDLATFEWALAAAFDAADGPVLHAADLNGIAPEMWATLHFEVHPSLQLLRVDWPVQNARAHVERGEPVGVLEPSATALCVWRDQFKVLHRQLGEAEWLTLRLLAEGRAFGDACATVAEATGETEAPILIASALQHWVSAGWLSPIAKS